MRHFGNWRRSQKRGIFLGSTGTPGQAGDQEFARHHRHRHPSIQANTSLLWSVHNFLPSDKRDTGAGKAQEIRYLPVGTKGVSWALTHSWHSVAGGMWELGR